MRGGILSILLAVIPALGQYLETTIQLPDSAWPHTVLYNPSNNRVYCSAGNRDTVYVVDGATNELVGRIGVGDYPTAMVCDPGRNKIYCTNWNQGAVSVIDCTSDSVVATVPVWDRPNALCFSPAAGRVFCANWSSDKPDEVTVHFRAKSAISGGTVTGDGLHKIPPQGFIDFSDSSRTVSPMVGHARWRCVWVL